MENNVWRLKSRGFAIQDRFRVCKTWWSWLKETGRKRKETWRNHRVWSEPKMEDHSFSADLGLEKKDINTQCLQQQHTGTIVTFCESAIIRELSHVMGEPRSSAHLCTAWYGPYMAVTWGELSQNSDNFCLQWQSDDIQNMVRAAADLVSFWGLRVVSSECYAMSRGWLWRTCPWWAPVRLMLAPARFCCCDRFLYKVSILCLVLINAFKVIQCISFSFKILYWHHFKWSCSLGSNPTCMAI